VKKWWRAIGGVSVYRHAGIIVANGSMEKRRNGNIRLKTAWRGSRASATATSGKC